MIRWAATVLALLVGTCFSAMAQPDPARTRVRAGDLALTLERAADGVRLASLLDGVTQRELLAAQSLPLFTLALRRAGEKEERRLAADSGWRQVVVEPAADGLEIRWQQPDEPRLRGIAVIARAELDRKAGAIRWRLRVENRSPEWSVWRVVFPQLALTDPGEQGSLFIPRGPGEVQCGVWQRAFRYRGPYADCWTTMQFAAVYAQGTGARPASGLYVGAHDPWGSAKEITAESRPEERLVSLAFDHPAPDMGIAGNEFAPDGEVVWQLLRGDWFDAAMIYKSWARREARWFPRRIAGGRRDTPPWMRELCAWVLTGGAPKECVPAVKEFARFLGVPVGFHWYNWHQIPFDNDYPHYFPPKEGFGEGVRELQQAGVFVMPYINGRLWDTRDRGAEDFEFSRVAVPAATKDEEGKPYTESYGSKESDGTPVRLAVMCPATKLWQDRVRGIVLQLFNEFGLNGVYIDQVAAAQPRLCFDQTHGHPLGGGHWWNEGYWRMLAAIRRAKPADRMLTTECNGEPFLHRFDGYLTWHWQHDGQVPAFPAIYGGAIQMFGRAYRGGATKDQAFRMKAGQQLVFGEQIGWIDPNIVRERENAEFLRQLVRLRWHLRRYFDVGEMARPPKLTGQIPTVRADWQWSGEWWVTTDAVLAGAWRLPREDKLVLLFVNVSDSAVTASLPFDGRAYGLKARGLNIRAFTDPEKVETLTADASFIRELTVEALTAVAWEIEAEA